MQKIGNWFVIFCLALMTIIVNLQVFYRFILKNPLSWTIELSTYLLVYAVLIGAGTALIRLEFIKVEFFQNLMPHKIQWFFELFSNFLILWFLYISVTGSETLIQQAALTQVVSPALNVEMEYIYRGFQIGFLYLGFFNIIRIIELIAAGPQIKKGANQ